MTEPLFLSTGDEQALQAEIIRQDKVIQALMNRAERSTNSHSSEFHLFQTTIMLQEQVQRRTYELEASLRENEKINRALMEAEEKFHSILDQSLVGITLFIDNRLHYVNPKFADIVGYSVEALLQMTDPFVLIKATDRDVTRTAMQKMLIGDYKNAQYVIDIECQNQELITVDCAVNGPVKIGGQSSVIAVWKDITERLRNEKEVKNLQEKLREQALHDPLTGLYNRHYLNESLERELALAQRHGYPVSVIMADLDHFKAINDRYGHLSGDEVLRNFSSLLMQHARSSDVFCRFGGEEFFLVMPNMEISTAYQRTELIRQSFAASQVCFADVCIKVTASFGIAAFPEHGHTANTLLDAADKALYAAKVTGRNCVKLSEDPRGF
jgi:diguanylate cyclase (GGDEF)-like protein/PAS domain S-box-containing protein